MLISPRSLVPFCNVFSTPPNNKDRIAFLMNCKPDKDGAIELDSNSNMLENLLIRRILETSSEDN